MSLPRFVLSISVPTVGNLLLTLEAEHAKHCMALRLKPGDSLELLFPSGAWRAELTEAGKGRAIVRLVCPLEENREAPVAIEACLPITAQLSLWDDWLPSCVELGATLIQPVVYARSEYNTQKTLARVDRWSRIIAQACEQSHRSRIPELRTPIPFEGLLTWQTAQKWVAYEVMVGSVNPTLRREAIAFTHGPEGGISDKEFTALQKAGWQSLTLGKSILRAVTCPAAILGAIQSRLY